jgi:CRP/FNR family transcriptional regulator, anaerobic regulatory protein
MTLMTGIRYAGYSRRMPEAPAPTLFPFIAAMAPESRGALESALRRVSCKGGTHLVARGDEVAGAYLVEEGALRVYYTSEDGREGTLYWVEPGQTCILALNSTFSRLAYPAWVESEGATRFAIVPGDVYRRLFACDVAVQQFTFGALSGRLFELMELMEETASHGLEARVAAFLLRRAKGEERVVLTQEQLARHLTTSREVVSRVLRGLSALGLVSSGHGQIVIMDSEGLRRIAG